MDSASPWMNAELEGLRDAVRRFVDSEIVPHHERRRKQQHVERVQRIYGGANEIMKEIIARSL